MKWAEKREESYMERQMDRKWDICCVNFLGSYSTASASSNMMSFSLFFRAFFYLLIFECSSATSNLGACYFFSNFKIFGYTFQWSLVSQGNQFLRKGIVNTCLEILCLLCSLCPSCKRFSKGIFFCLLTSNDHIVWDQNVSSQPHPGA